LLKKERQDETQFITKIDAFSEFHPLLNANVLFCRFKKKSHPVYDQTQGSGAVFSYFLNNSNFWIPSSNSICLFFFFFG
jgi:hypothetical protein